MIKIQITDKRIAVTGHANYAPHGEDIVCAAVSVLFQTLVVSIEELAQPETGQWYYNLGPGNSFIEYENGDERINLLIRSFILGAEMISDVYPQYVEIVDQACKS